MINMLTMDLEWLLTQRGRRRGAGKACATARTMRRLWEAVSFLLFSKCAPELRRRSSGHDNHFKHTVLYDLQEPQ